jgi:hypothetical protein
LYIQFAAGTTSLVATALRGAYKRVHIEYEDDSAIVFETASAVYSADTFPFAKNVFEVVSEVPRGNLARSIDQLTRRVSTTKIANRRIAPQGFRVMFHLDGSLIQADAKVRSRLEREISARTGARVQARGSGAEFWVVGRRELGSLLLCLRLPKRKLPATKGALSSELAALLVSASQPRKNDVFLDPFGGSGALVRARAQLPARELIYSDIELARFRRDALRPLLRDRRVRLLAEDATDLPSVRSGSISSVVTDPPWGEHEDLAMPAPEFARAVCESLDRVVMRERGHVVILMSRRLAPPFESALRAASFTVGPDNPRVLVNGHPATVIIATR